MTVTPEPGAARQLHPALLRRGRGAADQARQPDARSSTALQAGGADTKVSILQNVDAETVVHKVLPQAQVMQIDTQANVIQALEAEPRRRGRGRSLDGAVAGQAQAGQVRRLPARAGTRMLYGAALRQGDLDWLHFVNTTFNVAMFGHQNDDLRPGLRGLFRPEAAGAAARASRRSDAASGGRPSRARRPTCGRMSYHLNFNLIWRYFDKLCWGLLLSLELAVVCDRDRHRHRAGAGASALRRRPAPAARASSRPMSSSSATCR